MNRINLLLAPGTRVIGEGKDTLVMIQGGPYNSSYLSSDLTPLAAHHTLVYYDLRASGYSSTVRDTAKWYIYQTLSLDLLSELAKVKVPVLIIGGEEYELVRLINKAEWGRVADLYARDASILVPGAPPIVGRDAISSFWYTASVRGMSSIELQLMDLEISGNFLIAKGKYQMNDQQKEIIDIGKFIAIYRSEKGKWILQTDKLNTSMETRSPIEVPDYLEL